MCHLGLLAGGLELVTQHLCCSLCCLLLGVAGGHTRLQLCETVLRSRGHTVTAGGPLRAGFCPHGHVDTGVSSLCVLCGGGQQPVVLWARQPGPRTCRAACCWQAPRVALHDGGQLGARCCKLRLGLRRLLGGCLHA